ncbi:hypothetical protein [Mesorhizobium sp. J18]|uniref:hypothetical protein n=1 Tax=Mesorhizobium sp. J18 TaxID=935263 RepID=UPI00119E4BC4|nr:hypothetical protein [Mesorhizobium sp. J18]
MSSSVFRQIAQGGEGGKAERLFRAAVSAFCSLPRPSRSEIVQLDDLTLPLLDCVPADARRFAAAALSECESVPPGLLRRLANEPVEISEPLLVRSRALRDIDLIALIGRHGLPHARAIARRPGLNPAIADLVRALIAHADKPKQDEAAGRRKGMAEEAVRERLREMMRATDGDEKAASADQNAGEPSYDELRRAALSGDASRLRTVLAKALGLDHEQARRLLTASSYLDLMTGLRAIGLETEQAFLLTAAAFPAYFGHSQAVRLFVERFERMEPGAAQAFLQRRSPGDAARRNALRA